MSAGKRTGYASLPLHGGKAPAWLFSRMVLLSREILTHIVLSRGGPSPRSTPLRLRGPCAPRRSRLRTGAHEVLRGAFSQREARSRRARASGGGAPRALTKDVRSVLVYKWIAAVYDRLGRDPDVLVHASRTAAKVDNADLRHCREHARPRALRVRAWRHGRQPCSVSGNVGCQQPLP